MTRALTSYASSRAKTFLDALANAATSPTDYQLAMTGLGRELADAMLKTVPELSDRSVCIACTVEDADYLARGIVETLEHSGTDPNRIKLVCFWNERVRSFDDSAERRFDVAPIVKTYKEDVDLQQSIVVVVKSIISGAGVVKTNLIALVDHMVPERVLVAAPVMLEGADERLASEFPKQTSDRFEYFTFAIDTERSEDGEVVLPGIGGSVYERLGFTNRMAYVPEIVRSRRQRFPRTRA